MTDGLQHLSDTQAEAALVGGMMLRRTVVEVAAASLVASDFHSPANALIFDAAVDLLERGDDIDPQTVASQLGDSIDRAGGRQRLLELVSKVPSTSSAPTYIGRIKECANRRAVYRAANDTLERISVGIDAAAASDLLAEQIAKVEISAGSRQLVTESFEDLASAHPDTLPEWVIPGMMRRGNRMMITAPVKTGKATLIRQIAFATSRGLHPFTRDPIEPRRVLLLDLENPRETYAEQHNKHMVKRMGAMRPSIPEGQLQVLMRDQGINLRARSDRLLLEDLLRRQRPDLLCICPVYKSFNEDGRMKPDVLVKEVCEIFDHLRSTYDCALILEHHSPRGSVDLLPFGSSVWERWVEFGKTMRKSETNPNYVEFGQFCDGDRVNVTWPVGFERGDQGWPWIAKYADGEYPNDLPI